MYKSFVYIYPAPLASPIRRGAALLASSRVATRLYAQYARRIIFTCIITRRDAFYNNFERDIMGVLCGCYRCHVGVLRPGLAERRVCQRPSWFIK